MAPLFLLPMLLEMKANCTKDKKVYADKNKLWPGKGGCHRPSGLDVRSTVMVRQADKP